MYEQQKSILEQKIKELSNKAILKKPPKVKFSDKIRLASTKIFRNEKYNSKKSEREGRMS